jgi:hypothetical protein
MVVAIVVFTVGIPVLVKIPIVRVVLGMHVIAVTRVIVIGVPAVPVAVANHAGYSRLSSYNHPKGGQSR